MLSRFGRKVDASMRKSRVQMLLYRKVRSQVPVNLKKEYPVALAGPSLRKWAV